MGYANGEGHVPPPWAHAISVLAGMAIADLSRFIAFAPSDGPARNERMLAFFSAGDYDEAWVDAHHLFKSGYRVEPGFLETLRAASGLNE